MTLRPLLVLPYLFWVGGLEAQVAPSVQVPLDTPTGWGAVAAPDGYKALRIQGRTTTDRKALARLFADFAAHPTMFPRVVANVEILACDVSSLRMRYRTMFDSRPGGKTSVESLSNLKVAEKEDRIEFTWSSSEVQSKFVQAAWGRALFVTQQGPHGAETLIDYVSAVRPRNAAKAILVESQKGVLAGDARYVIDRLIALGKQTSPTTTQPSLGLLKCPAAIRH